MENINHLDVLKLVQIIKGQFHLNGTLHMCIIWPVAEVWAIHYSSFKS